jgi:hypothetical protein
LIDCSAGLRLGPAKRDDHDDPADPRDDTSSRLAVAARQAARRRAQAIARWDTGVRPSIGYTKF